MAEYIDMKDIKSPLSLEEYTIDNFISDNGSYVTKNRSKPEPNSSTKVAKLTDYSEIRDISPTKPINLGEDITYPQLKLAQLPTILDVVDPVRPIDVLMSQEPDFMKNMYNIYIMMCSKDTYPERAMTAGEPIGDFPQKTSGRDFLYTSPDKNWTIIGMRTDSISIPQSKQTSSVIKVAGQTVSKIMGKLELTNKGALSVRLDQSMFILDAFHQLSHDYFAKERKIADSITEIKGKEFYNAYGSLPLHSAASKTSIIDIIVEYDADYLTMSEHNNKTERLNSRKADTRYYPNAAERMQRYILHDCRFLGRDSSLDFSDKAEPMKATFPFVFRRAVHVSDRGLN